MDIQEVLAHLPHRYPFLLIDRVTECRPGEFLTGIKNVSANEPFFQGHFPGLPVMPGVLILEALAQATGILAFQTEGERPDGSHIYMFVGIDKARFKRTVVPGDRLDLRVDLDRVRRGIWIFKGAATVEGAVVTSAELMCTKRPVAEV